MRIKSIFVRNFRCVRESELMCHPLTAVLGRNGAGKSTFLHALEMFYDVAAKLTDEDFFGRDTGEPIEIRVTYGGLRPDEAREFEPYLTRGELSVTKRIEWTNGNITQRYYAAAMQVPEFAQIRSIAGKKDKITAWSALVDEGKYEGFQRVRRADDIEPMMSEFEASHPDVLKPVEREEQFFGPKNIGGGKLDKYTRFVLVPAVREASEETSGKKGAISQLVELIVLRRVNAREDVKALRQEFEDRVKEVYSSENLTELPELGGEITATLRRFAPGSELVLDWDDVQPPEIALPDARPSLVEDGFQGEIEKKGHGLQRALVLTLLQHLAMTTPAGEGEGQPQGEDDTEEAGGTPESPPGPDLILGVEEPELYLHPSRCRHLAKVLFELTTDPPGDEGTRNQVVFTTHSPYFVDIQRFESIRVVRKSPLEGADVLHSTVTKFTVEEAVAELARVAGLPEQKITARSFKVRTLPVMSVVVNEGFFAEVAVIVEGTSELGILGRLQDILGKGWHEGGIALIPVLGKNNIDRPSIIFRGLGVPSYVVFDGDSRYSGRGDDKEKQAIQSNHRLLRLLGGEEADFPKTQVCGEWAVFEDNIETCIRDALGQKVLDALRDRVAHEVGLGDNPGRVHKNMEAAAKLIELAYTEGHRIPVLEQVVEAVTNLLPRPSEA